MSNLQSNSTDNDFPADDELIIEGTLVDSDEERAMQSGWVPQDQWKGDPNLWRPAREFNERGELLTHIKKLNKESHEMKRAIAALGEINRKTAEYEREKALADLKVMRKEAFRNQDIDMADELTEKMEELKNADVSASVDESAPVKPNEIFLEWAENNQWYLDNKMLQGAANAIGDEILAEDERAREDQRYLLKQVEKRMKQEFPSKILPAGSKVADAGQGRNRSGSSSIASRLSEEETNVGRTLVKCGAFATLDDYAKSLNKGK